MLLYRIQSKELWPQYFDLFLVDTNVFCIPSFRSQFVGIRNCFIAIRSTKVVRVWDIAVVVIVHEQTGSTMIMPKSKRDYYIARLTDFLINLSSDKQISRC